MKLEKRKKLLDWRENRVSKRKKLQQADRGWKMADFGGKSTRLLSLSFFFSMCTTLLRCDREERSCGSKS